jgi:hypothetical protein
LTIGTRFAFADRGLKQRIRALNLFIDAFQVQWNQVGDAIHETFFTLRPVAAAQTQRQHQAG